jgi:hypothetical protein
MNLECLGLGRTIKSTRIIQIARRAEGQKMKEKLKKLTRKKICELIFGSPWQCGYFQKF